MGTLYKRKEINSVYYYARYKNREGKTVRRCTMVRDKVAATKLLAQWEAEEQLFAHKVRDEAAERSAEMAGKQLLGQVKEYESSMVTAGRSDTHVARTIQLITNTAAAAGWQTLSDISAPALEKYSADQLRAGLAARTVASAITAVRSFCRWAVKHGRLKTDPTAGVGKPSSVGDRRIARRMLLPAEWRWISRTLRGQPVERNGQSAQERLLMYWTAIETGLRSNELRQLTKAKLKLDGEPHVLAPAATTKNKAMALQFIGDALAEELRKYIRDIRGTNHLFCPASRVDMAAVLREDLAAARALWESVEKRSESELDSDFLKPTNDHNETIDFHALRHTCGGWLVMQGVTLPEVQSIMRHSTITLTIDCYGHIAPDARSKSRNVLGALLS